jgi:hypothetical protein
MRTVILACALVLGALGPAAAAPKTIKAELGHEFTLQKGQRAELNGTDASVRITGFINSPCPKGTRCIWSGQKVNLELTVAGSTVALDGSAPFEVKVVASDYKTRAALLALRRLAR